MNNRQRIQTDNAPAAIGPYSQAIKVGNFVYTAGQVGLDPATGDLIQGGIKEQTRQALTNVAAVLDAAGCSPSDVVKTTVFIMDMADFAAMNEVYAGVFGTDNPPARSTVQVAGLPRGARVEIECVAVLGGGE
ncbi:MAG TPA: RidA family protein [Chloroflexia bacterium]|jgi:2-iminobutanoate/2-iminopropanoate deaminase